MMRSMYSGVSGLKNHQIKMDVIGNNIANVNTVGFKKSRAVFKDTLYQSFKGASSPTTNRGGTNPMGIGLGMTLNSVEQLHLAAPTMTTNKSTDMAIDGNGYFMVKNGGQQLFTRAGAFDFDTQGYLVNTSNGFRVAGWVADRDSWNITGYKINTTPEADTISISDLKTLQPTATTEMIFSGNLSAKTTAIADDTTTTPPFTVFTGTPAMSNLIDSVPVDTENGDYDNKIVTSKEVYDSLGNKVTVYFKFFKTQDATTNAVNWHCDVSLNPKFESTETPPATPIIKSDLKTVTSDGTLAEDDFGVIPDSGVLRIQNLMSFNNNGEVDSTVPLIKALKIGRSSYNAEDIEFRVDLSKLTQYEPKSSASAESQNGYSSGNLTSYTVGTDGTISGTYDNGLVRGLARIAVFSFINPSGLVQAGSTLFQVSNNSGDAKKGAPGEQGMGAIVPNSLEMSNVDLSEEFTDMITTQRGFQANSRTITTTDEMIQELVNLKR